MSSNISTTGINTSYPIAGQDNDTQGFRDNFSSIKYNLTTAATEITALQANVSGFGTIISNVSTIQTQLVNGSFANITLTSALSLANISTTQRASISPSNGMLIYNNTYNKFQGYANGAWGNITLS